MKWVCFPKFYSPLANWPWLRISRQSSLNVIDYLIISAWQWLMSFTCILVQIEPSKSPLRNRLLVFLLWEIGHLSSPSRSCLGRLIFIHGRQGALRAKLPHTPGQGMTPPLFFYSGNPRPLKNLFECKFGELGKVTQGFYLGQMVLCWFRNFLKGRGRLGTLCGQRNLFGVTLCYSSRCHWNIRK